MLTVAIRTWMPGQSDQTDSLALEVERLSAAEFIRSVVEKQVDEEQERLRLLQESNEAVSAVPQTRNIIYALSRTANMAELLDAAQQTRKAWHAFTANRYLLLIDNQRVQSLEEELILTSETKVVFLQLTPLVGG